MKRISELINDYKNNPTPETAENILKILGQLENPSALDDVRELALLKEKGIKTFVTLVHFFGA